MDTRSGHGDASNGSTATEAATGVGARERNRGPEGASTASPDFIPPAGAAVESPAAGPAAAERLVDDAQDLALAVRQLVSARYDQFRLTLRRAMLWGILAVMAAGALAALAASACVLVVIGIAGAISQATGAPVWVGQLLTGVGLIAGGGLIGFGLVRLWQRSSLRKTLKRYGKIDR